MINSERFLVAFNSIEKVLRGFSNSNYHMSFVKLIMQLAKVNSIVRKYENDLREFAELRNAIVHERTDTTFVIAEPHTTVVEKIEYIANELKSPQKVIPLFTRKVICFQIDDMIADVLKAIRKHGYSQFPIYEDDKFVCLLTEREIINWLARNFEKSLGSMYDILVEDVLMYQTRTENFYFISKNDNVYDVRETFKRLEKENSRPEALLITANGLQSEVLLGLITPRDLINLP